MPTWGLSKDIETNLQTWDLAFNKYKAFLKKHTTSLPASFSAWLSKKNTSLVINKLIDQISWSVCFYFVRYWAICVL